jgi:hypothetical protein
MNKKLNNKQINELRDLAKLIPVTYDEVNIHREVFGSQLIAGGITEIQAKELMPEIEWENGKPEFTVKMVPVVANKKYSFPMKHKVKTDHFKRIKKLYAKEGIDAVRNYAYGCRQLLVESAAPRMIGGIMTMPC